MFIQKKNVFDLFSFIFQQSTVTELLWVQRLAIVFIGASATMISIYVPIIYGMFILAADIVYVIVFPQLTCALFLKFTNSYGAIGGLLVGVIGRFGAGENYINLEYFIKYPFYDDQLGQIFPYRTFSMVASFIVIILVSIITNLLFHKNYLPHKCDILKIHKQQANQYSITSQEPRQDVTFTDSKIATIDSKHSSNASLFHMGALPRNGVAH